MGRAASGRHEFWSAPAAAFAVAATTRAIAAKLHAIITREIAMVGPTHPATVITVS